MVAAAGRPPRLTRRRAAWGLAGLLLACLLAVKLLVAEPFRIPSASMAPTLVAGDRVLVDKRAYHDDLPRRGHLVVFHEPGSGDVALKRVVGVAGDTVGLEDGVLVVNGRRPVEPYADPAAQDTVYFGPVRVRRDAIFVLGDNRGDSRDSRDFGAVAAGDLIGRVVARIWPPGRWGSPN